MFNMPFIHCDYLKGKCSEHRSPKYVTRKCSPTTHTHTFKVCSFMGAAFDEAFGKTLGLNIH